MDKTHLEKLEELLKEFELPYSKEVGVNKVIIHIECTIYDPLFKTDKIKGYNGMFTDYEFNKDGKFLTLEIRE